MSLVGREGRSDLFAFGGIRGPAGDMLSSH